MEVVAVVTKYLKHITLFILVVALCAVSVSAHKEASETWASSTKYYLAFGLVPGYITAGEPQAMYIRPETPSDTYVSGLQAHFSVFVNNASAAKEGRQLGTGWNDIKLVELEAEEEVFGHYVVRYTFPEPGSYQIQARLFDGEVLLGELVKEVHAEPVGPTPQFWIYMIAMVILGAFVASKSDRLK